MTRDQSHTRRESYKVKFTSHCLFRVTPEGPNSKPKGVPSPNAVRHPGCHDGSSPPTFEEGAFMHYFHVVKTMQSNKV